MSRQPELTEASFQQDQRSLRQAQRSLGEKGAFRFKREERLKGRDAIKAVFGKGRRIGCRGAKLFVLKNGLPHNRICFSFPRGFGTAAERNRAKRLGREAFRGLKPCLRQGYDLVLLVYPDSADDFAGRNGQLRHLCARAGMLK